MKRFKLSIFILTFFAIFLNGCVHIKPVIVYPTDIKPEKFAELKKRVHQGEKLFRRNCENCHGITKKIKDSVVKLDLSNIVRYHKAFLRGDNKNHAFSQHLSNDELTDILLFIEVVKKD